MPAHRSPGGLRLPSPAAALPTAAAPSPAAALPSSTRLSPAAAVRAAFPSTARRASTTTVAAGAAFGVVASGAFAAVVPTSLDGHSTQADAATDTTATTMLAAQTSPMRPVSGAETTGYFSPVSFADASSATTPDQPPEMASFDKASKIAERIAAEHARAELAEQQAQAARAALEKTIAAGGLNAWIAEALDHMGLPQSYAPALRKIILKESNGNPRAINNWDSNAAAGNPSEGLMQVIPSTFEKFVHPDFADEPITDPVANITAGVRYMIDRYGKDTLAAGGRSGSNGGYVGY